MSGWGTPDDPIRISEINFAARPESYPGIVLMGDSRARGRTQGRLFADKIKANITRSLARDDLPPWPECQQIIRKVYIPSLRKGWKKGLQELQGMATGCGESLEKLVFLNARDDLAAIAHLLKQSNGDASEQSRARQRRVDETTSAFFGPPTTQDGDAIAVHSWTSSKGTYDDGLVVYLEIHYNLSECLPSMFVVTEAGVLAGSGMNSDGLAIVANSLLSSADFIPGPGDNCLPSACIRRRLLEYEDINEVQEYCVYVGKHTSMNILAAEDSGRSCSFEIGPDHIFYYHGELDTSAVLHTNHFQSFEAFLGRREINDENRSRDSRLRLSRLSHLVAKHRGQEITSRSIQDMFSDHQESPSSICQHAKEGQENMTVSFVVYNLDDRVITVCKGPPCQSRMMHFKLEETEGDDSDVEMEHAKKSLETIKEEDEPDDNKQDIKEERPRLSQFDKFYIGYKGKTTGTEANKTKQEVKKEPGSMGTSLDDMMGG